MSCDHASTHAVTFYIFLFTYLQGKFQIFLYTVRKKCIKPYIDTSWLYYDWHYQCSVVNLYATKGHFVII